MSPAMLRPTRQDCLNEVVGSLVSIRELKGLGQNRLSTNAKLSEVYFGAMERGARPVTAAALDKFLDALDVGAQEAKRIRWWFALSQVTDDGTRHDILRSRRPPLLRKHPDFIPQPGRLRALRSQAHGSSATGARPA